VEAEKLASGVRCDHTFMHEPMNVWSGECLEEEPAG
jgi:hypothetical protein